MLLAAGLVFGGTLFSQVQKNSEGSGKSSEKTLVDVKADKYYHNKTLNTSRGIDENAKIMVGNVAFHHNGAIIACDSAVQYSNNRIECFSASGRNDIIINKDSIFIYCNSVEYDGDRNLARVISPVIKVVDGDATLYTYNFTFNTKDNIGKWSGGGVMYQQDNVMESEVGYFYSDLHELVANRAVQMKNDSHQIISDSVRYNTETKIADFYTRTYIWTKDGEIISAKKGRYHTQDSLYFFHDEAYILDEFRETWADTIDFDARMKDAVFYGNIQIDDSEHSSSAFGDLAHYWGERGETRLTRRPSLLNYDADQGNADTMYMRADTVYMYVRYPSDGRRRDSIGGDGATEEGIDRFAHLKWVDSLSDSVRIALADSLVPVIASLRDKIAGLRSHADSIMNVLYPAAPAPAITDTMPPPDANVAPLPDYIVPKVDSLSATDSLPAVIAPLPDVPPAPGPEPEKPEPPEVVELRTRIVELSSEADSLATAEGYIRPRIPGGMQDARIADSLAQLRLDSISRADSLLKIDSIRIANPKVYKKLQKAEVKRLKAEKALLAAKQREAQFKAKAAARAEKQRLKAEKRIAKRIEKAKRLAATGRLARHSRYAGLLDSLARADSLAGLDSLRRLDSLLHLDSLALLDSIPPLRDSVTTEADTTMRIFRGWRDVKIWRKDMQAVCDSMVGFSVDSTIHLYRNPIMWHADSQITSDSMVIYTVGQKIDHAEFFGNPVMGSQIGGANSRQFNQVKGKRMVSLFRNGELYRHDTYENAMAYYYMQEEEQQPDGSTIMSEALAFLVATGARISFMFEADSLRDIGFYAGAEYTGYPMDQIPTSQPTQMREFVWRVGRKPILADVFDRRVRPSERTFHEGLTRPEFPIATRIDNRREYLISNRMWVDRNDSLPDYAVRFRREMYREEQSGGQQ